MYQKFKTFYLSIKYGLYLHFYIKKASHIVSEDLKFHLFDE